MTVNRWPFPWPEGEERRQLARQVIVATQDLEPTIRSTNACRVRRINVIPEFDCAYGCAHGIESCAGPGSPGYHGAGGRRVEFAVSQYGVGAASFTFHPAIYPPSVVNRMAPQDPYPLDLWLPIGDFIWHYVAPRCHDDRELPGTECVYTAQRGHQFGKCWHASTTMLAELAHSVLLHGGPEMMFRWLEEHLRRMAYELAGVSN